MRSNLKRHKLCVAFLCTYLRTNSQVYVRAPFLSKEGSRARTGKIKREEAEQAKKRQHSCYSQVPKYHSADQTRHDHVCRP